MMMMQAQEPAVAMKLPDCGDLQQPSQPVVLPGRHQKAPVEQLKCPRCESPNTKFCYYNNYSLTQPRYFCKNCRRYWTKGGSLRNVPVGGGCRKNKRVNQKPSQRSIDDTTASIGGAGLFCSSGLGPGGPFSTLIPPPNYPGNLPNPNSPFGLTFACLQESLIRSTDFNTYTNPNPLNSFVKTELVHNNNHNHNHNHNDPNSLSLLLDNYTSAASSVNQSLHAKPCAQPQSPFKLNLQQPKVAMQLQEEHHNNQQHQQQLMHPIFERSMQDHHNNMQEPSLFLQDAIAQNTSSHSFWVGNNNNDTTPGWPEFFPLSGP